MSKRSPLILSFALVLLLAPAGVVSASAPNAPTAAPCGTETTYDPACDVNHDGWIDIIDIQRTADKWNKSGDWVADNDHDHLGQTWMGNNNPLKIEGSFAVVPDHVALAGSNTATDSIGVRGEANASGSVGVWGQSNLNTGVFGLSTDGVGVWGQSGTGPAIRAVSADSLGVYVQWAGVDGVYVDSTGSNGVHVWSAGSNGVHVSSAGSDGMRVFSAGNPTTTACSVANNGFEVCGAEGNGLFVGHAGGNGLNVAGADLAGYFGGHIQVTESCAGCVLTTFALNTGDTDLAPGDIVSLAGLRESGVDSVPMLMDVKAANGTDAAVGVVSGWAELVTEEEPRPNEIGQRLVPRKGVAEPGQYVTVVYSGLAQVKVNGPIQEGMSLVAGTNGSARAKATLKVQLANGEGTAEIPETAPEIGIALEGLEAGEGLVWALVNVQ